MVILFKSVHPEKGFASIKHLAALNKTDDNCVQLLKAFFPIFVTLSGMVIFGSLVHESNACSPIVLREVGRVIDVILLQKEKEVAGIILTCCPIIMLVNFLQVENGYFMFVQLIASKLTDSKLIQL